MVTGGSLLTSYSKADKNAQHTLCVFVCFLCYFIMGMTIDIITNYGLDEVCFFQWKAYCPLVSTS